MPNKFLALAVSLTGPAAAQPNIPEARTAEAVLAADKAWGEAENRGDAAFVDWLLLPGYQSIGADGKSASKDRIVAGARARGSSAAAAAKTAASSAAWEAAHPLRGNVALFGDTAVLTWISIKPGSGEPVSSSDVFIFVDGHWHAIYSQHSTASS